ncbi:MAG: 4-(cytidine 5'-diphospho)-2-C-methyl-D-erythritol kinase, partial [Dehalococcoidia bacterium]|nr:4-(cytidine 5'-diphospho)-2-C-methyl-D-erythritol kinase [Dehalococcoidia bacterium]
AYAKINLTLEVLSDREDGYHEITTILQTISLHDQLTVEPAPDIQLTCALPELAGESNLGYKAALLLKETTGYKGGARISLQKYIPAAAGLGGGSSDAAATLRGLNELWGLGLTMEELMPLAAQLGSDVPFFLYGGTALATGRGEKINPLANIPKTELVVCSPEVVVPGKTSLMYSLLDLDDYTDGSHSLRVALDIYSGVPIGSEHLFNVFQYHASIKFPQIAQYAKVLAGLGLDPILAGSGPSVFALLPEGMETQEVKGALDKEGLEAKIVSTVASYRSQ